MTTLRISGLVLAFAAACGGSPFEELTGVYEVSTHTLNPDGCDGEGADVAAFAFFNLRVDDLFGEEFLEFGECESADETSCQGFGLFSGYFDIEGEPVLRVSTSSGGGSVPCLLGLVEGFIIDRGGGVVRIETRTYGEEDPALSEEECDPDTAEARGTSMMCETFEVLEGARVD